MNDQPENTAAGGRLAEELAALRQQIDTVDAEILSLLNRRAGYALQIGEIKAKYGDEGFVYRPEREAQVLRRLLERNDGPLGDEQIAFFFREIMSACLALEARLTVAFLGPRGTFSEAAALKHFGHCAQMLPQLSIDDVFRVVAADQAQFAIAPVENSTEGAVGRTLDLLVSTPLKICGEVIVRIHQNLLSNCQELSAVRKVYSHAQSLAQCHEWLNLRLPHAERVTVTSNAQAAQMAAQEDGAAAIAGAEAGRYYRLTALAENVEDEANNTTRFLVLGKRNAGPTGQDKTSLILSTPNQAGALLRLIAPLVDAGISMTRLESRPSRGTLWEYVFFVDIEGHCEDEAVIKALQELQTRAVWLKVLGSYPVFVY